jgi:hypothetical protein
MTLKKAIYVGSAALALAVVGTSVLLQAAEAKAKYSIKDVMKTIHKGDDNIGKRVAGGKASQEDIAKMLEHYMALPQNEPPRGDKASWQEKTSAMLASARAVKEGKPGAIEAYKSATNCKACHNVHKPEDKK